MPPKQKNQSGGSKVKEDKVNIMYRYSPGPRDWLMWDGIRHLAWKMFAFHLQVDGYLLQGHIRRKINLPKSKNKSSKFSNRQHKPENLAKNSTRRKRRRFVKRKKLKLRNGRRRKQRSLSPFKCRRCRSVSIRRLCFVLSTSPVIVRRGRNVSSVMTRTWGERWRRRTCTKIPERKSWLVRQTVVLHLNRMIEELCYTQIRWSHGTKRNYET